MTIIIKPSFAHYKKDQDEQEETKIEDRNSFAFHAAKLARGKGEFELNAMNESGRGMKGGKKGMKEDDG